MEQSYHGGVWLPVALQCAWPSEREGVAWRATQLTSASRSIVRLVPKWTQVAATNRADGQ